MKLGSVMQKVIDNDQVAVEAGLLTNHKMKVKVTLKSAIPMKYETVINIKEAYPEEERQEMNDEENQYRWAQLKNTERQLRH